MSIKKRFRMSLTVSICLLAATSVAQAQYSGGSGTVDNSYQIATAADLIALGETPDDYDKHFILTADIDLDPNLPGRRVFDRAVIAADTDDDMAWFKDTCFSGHFDGQGHVISHLRIQGKDHLGLFGRLDSGAVIANLGLDAVDVRGNWYVGGLVGENYRGTILSSYCTGTVGGEDDVGGLVGQNHEGNISSSCSTAKVSGEDHIGGLVGYNDNGEIQSSHGAGMVSGRMRVGGLVGFSDNGSIWLSYSTGAVNGDLDAGGLVGDNSGSVSSSYSTGTVKGDNNVGGLVGCNLHGSIVSNFSTGMIRGTANVGGLVGYHEGGSILSSYSTSEVSGHIFVGGLVGASFPGSISSSYSTGTVSGKSHVGGLVGSNVNGVISSCFWDTQTSGLTGSADGMGLSTVQMQDINTFLEAGWDFIDETENGPNDVWKIVQGQTHPLLSWQNYGGGNGEPNAPYLIYTAEHLNALGAEPEDYDKHFQLMADIDLSRYSYDRAIMAPDIDDDEAGFQGTAFTGFFDGSHHTISHLTIAGEGFLGLFGRLQEGGEIVNLGLLDVDVAGGSYRIGGVAGENDGSISNCYSTGVVAGGNEVGGLVGNSGGSVWNCRSAGEVTGSASIGGLIGRNRGLDCEGNVSRCFTTASVRGWGWRVGGLIGFNSGNVVDCYSAGDVVGDFRVGGLVGYHAISSGGASIRNSYSTGAVTGDDRTGGLVGERWNRVDGSFWDTETSGQIVSADGTGLTTTEMQTAGTFLEAGWDFMDETDNGSDDIWWILEGQDYPRLWWELVEEDVVKTMSIH